MDIIQVVIQAGAVGIAVYTIYTLRKLIGNHINHNTDAIKELTKVIAELKQVIKNNGKRD